MKLFAKISEFRGMLQTQLAKRVEKCLKANQRPRGRTRREIFRLTVKTSFNEHLNEKMNS